MEYITLIGIVIFILGFALKLDNILIIIAAAIATALAGGLGVGGLLETLGSRFVDNRNITLFLTVLIVTGTLERSGLNEAAAALISKVKGASAGVIISVYADMRGFEPFGKETINPAFESVKRLPDTVAGASIVKLEIPTVFGEAGRAVEKGIIEHKPDVVICAGQVWRRRRYSGGTHRGQSDRSFDSG